MQYAKHKMLSYSHLCVIGVTGSYGKTSTKEFMSTLLKRYYAVEKTGGSENTDIAIAKTIIQKLSKKTNIFITEMGAYKMGEISSICDMTCPSIGVITGIDEQHLGLFGSIEKTCEAKFELILGLKKNGTAFFQTGNSYIRKIMEWTKIKRPDVKIWEYRLVSRERFEKEKLHTRTLIGFIQKVNPLYTRFAVRYGKTTKHIKTTLAGPTAVENILGAIAVALSFGVMFDDIALIVSSLQSPAQTMEINRFVEKGYYIDDTFNANYTGVQGLLDFMKSFSGKKILVLTPLIELGSRAHVLHRNIGIKAAKTCDFVYLTNENYFSDLCGHNDRGKKFSLIQNHTLERIKKEIITHGGVVAFEGKEAAKVLQDFSAT